MQPINLPDNASYNRGLLAHELLQMLRHRAGLTQEEMAALLGLKSGRMIMFWEGGQKLPRHENLKKLVELFIHRQVFLAGREKEEARQLWLAVKKASDAQYEKGKKYPDFDQTWFEALVRAENTITIANIQSLSSLPFSDPPNNLPALLTSFVGREWEISQVHKLLTTSRLVTLTGIGGIGKTRLALRIASEVLTNYPAGVWWLDLLSCDKPEQIPFALAAILEIEEEKGRSLLDTLASYFSNKPSLIVLDNSEQLVAACGVLVNTLLKSCPGLQFLVTSRQSLGVKAEICWQVPPLSVVDARKPRYLPTAQNLKRFEANLLFIERARAIRPDLVFGEEELRLITEICKQLEGIPLAIELAAVRIKVLTIAQIADKLKERFQFLTLGDRGKPPQQQILRQTIDQSYEFLSPGEQSLVLQLAIFPD